MALASSLLAWNASLGWNWNGEEKPDEHVEERFLAESLTDLSRLPPPSAGSTAAATTLQGPDGEQMAID